MPLVLDNPLFDALGLGADTKTVGLPHVKLDREGHAYNDEAVTQAHEDIWHDVEHPVSRILSSVTSTLAAPAAAAPMLLSYHSSDDAELAFIPKTLAGFAFGSILMGFCMNLSTVLFLGDITAAHHATLVSQLAQKFVFVVGIAGVAASLLLVALKVRADHNDCNLHSRHWLNSISTGAIFSLLIWGPWLAVERGFPIDRFLLALFWMLLLAFPVLAAKWTVGKAKTYGI